MSADGGHCFGRNQLVVDNLQQFRDAQFVHAGMVLPSLLLEGLVHALRKANRDDPLRLLVGSGAVRGLLSQLRQHLLNLLILGALLKLGKGGGIWVGAADNSIIAMLGASPGASTAAWIMVHVIERCFAPQLKDGGWAARMKEMIPSYGQSLVEDAALCRQIREETAAVLNLQNIPQ